MTNKGEGKESKTLMEGQLLPSTGGIDGRGLQNRGGSSSRAMWSPGTK